MTTAAADLGEFLIALTNKYELDYGQMLELLRGYVSGIEKKKAAFELKMLARRYG